MDKNVEVQNKIIDLLEKLGNKVERDVTVGSGFGITFDIFLKEKCLVLNQEENTGICFSKCFNEDELKEFLRDIYNYYAGCHKVNHIILVYNEDSIDDIFASNLNLYGNDIMSAYGYFSMQSFVECVSLIVLLRNIQEQYDLFRLSQKARNKGVPIKNEDSTNSQYVVYNVILRMKIKKGKQKSCNAKIFKRIFDIIPVILVLIAMIMIVYKYNIEILGAIIVAISSISRISHKYYGKSFAINYIQSLRITIKTRMHCNDNDINKIENEILQNKISLIKINLENNIAETNISKITRYLLLHNTSNIKDISQETNYGLSCINNILYALEKMNVAIKLNAFEWKINERYFAQ